MTETGTIVGELLNKKPRSTGYLGTERYNTLSGNMIITRGEV